MKNADEIAHQRIEAERAQSARLSDTEAKMRKANAAADAARLRRLQDNADFQWFMETFFEPLHQKNHEGALNLAFTPEQRTAFAHRYDLTKTLRELPAKKEAELRALAEEPVEG